MRTKQLPTSTPVSAGALVGAAWWAVGSLALPTGLGTLLLAAGLLLAGVLVGAAKRHAPRDEPVAPRTRTKVVRLLGFGALLVAAAVAGLNASGYGELAVPAAATVTGGCLVPLAGLLEQRGYLLLGVALMVLGAGGALLALRCAGGLYPGGLVGLGAGLLVWCGSAVEARPHREPLSRIGIR
jgi:hypothetical protein